VTLFRPCIDLHEGKVKQIVGGTLTDDGARENFVSERPASWFAEKYKTDGLFGGHVILLGPGNQEAAEGALRAFPLGLQVGGGISPENARRWLDLGASQVIVTSFLFDGPDFSEARLDEMLRVVSPAELCIDLSCRRVGDTYRVATNRWQTVTRTEVDPGLLNRLGDKCSELLVHAADVEGLCRGIDGRLVEFLGAHTALPCTYAGGAADIDDLRRVAQLSQGRLDLTFGSALDLFGGRQVRYEDCLAWNRAQQLQAAPFQSE
jgi:phosphoribosylformimino-5-aminoimidazole carboxamide ribotide isomerase